VLPSGFQIFYIDNFPNFKDNTISTSTQLLLIDPSGNENQSEIHSKITKSNKTVLNYEQFKIYHEHPRNIYYRIYEKVLNKLIEINEFNAYYSSNSNRFIIEAPKDLAIDAMKTFDKHSIIKATQKDVDFQDILKRANNVYGNWFGSLPPGRVKTIAIFGDHVNLSMQYEDLINSGAELKYIIIELEIENQIYKVGISRNRGITFYENIDLIDKLTFIEQMHEFFD
jgi:hypothetical protein